MSLSKAVRPMLQMRSMSTGNNIIKSPYFVEERKPSALFLKMSQSIQFRFKSGGWVTPKGQWALLWAKPSNVEVDTEKCQMVEFNTTSGEKVKAWRC